MRAIVVQLPRLVKRRLQTLVRQTKDAGLKTRALILLHYAAGRTSAQVAEAVHYDISAVRKVRERFLREGEMALIDRRCENGQPKVNADLLEALRLVLTKTPPDFQWARPTWTQELLARTLADLTGVEVSASTVGRMLDTLKARWGQPKPVVSCWWPKARRQRRLRELTALIENLPNDEVVLYEDEVDIDLNPRIGRDWMLPGTQRLVMTPGKNAKYYVAGALNAKTGELLYVGHDRKNNELFRNLLERVAKRYPRAKRIHLIVDNFSIHDAKAVRRDLDRKYAGRIVLHFLPPYCPDANRIERLWRELHANVTRNHRCTTLMQLLSNVRHFLDHVSPYPGTRTSLLKAA